MHIDRQCPRPKAQRNPSLASMFPSFQHLRCACHLYQLALLKSAVLVTSLKLFLCQNPVIYRNHLARLGKWMMRGVIELLSSLRTGIVGYKQLSRAAVYPQSFQTQASRVLTICIDCLPFVLSSCLPCIKQYTTKVGSHWFSWPRSKSYGFLMSVYKFYFVLL